MTENGPQKCHVIKAKMIRITKEGEAQLATVTGQAVSVNGVTPEQIQAMIKQIISSGGSAQVENSQINIDRGYVALLNQLNALIQQQKQKQQAAQQQTPPKTKKAIATTPAKKKTPKKEKKQTTTSETTANNKHSSDPSVCI
ncbi:MAG: hypothetical protein SGARI_002020 [Bacillariaceae sp.]